MLEHNNPKFNIQPWCSTKVDDDGIHAGVDPETGGTTKEELMNIGFCGPDCPMHPYAFRNDDTLKVTHHYDQKQLTVTLKLLGIMGSSLLLIGLMVTGSGKLQGISSNLIHKLQNIFVVTLNCFFFYNYVSKLQPC